MKTISKLPLISSTRKQPLWNSDYSNPNYPPNVSVHREDYPGHRHLTKRTGQSNCLISKTYKPKLAYTKSYINLDAVDEIAKDSSIGQNWLKDELNSKYVTWRRIGQLTLPSSKFDKKSDYQMEYTKKKAEKREKRQHETQEFLVGSANEFDQKTAPTSIYAKDFAKHNAERSFLCFKPKPPIDHNIITWRDDLRPPRKSEASDDAHEKPARFASLYRSDFLFNRQPASKVTIANRGQLQQDQMLHGPFTDTSLYQESYQRKPIQPANRPASPKTHHYEASMFADQKCEIGKFTEYRQGMFYKVPEIC